MNIIVIKIDDAFSMADLEVSEDSIKFPSKGEICNYKYLSFFPLQKNCNKLWPVCSKDLKEWTLCAGATKNGERLDFSYLTAIFEELMDLGVTFIDAEIGGQT